MGTIPASENEFPQVLFAEGAAPATPATGLVVCYVKADGLLYCKDDAGTETAYAAAGTALADHLADTADAHDASAVSVLDTAAVFTATDVEAALKELYDGIAAGGIPVTIIDAAGDLIVGSAADTATRLAIGNAGGHVSRINGAVAWDSGTAFPTAVTGDRFYRTDLLGGSEWKYDGTRWRSVQTYISPMHLKDSTVFTGDSVSTGPFGRWSLPFNGSTYTVYVIAIEITTIVLTTNDATNRWTFAWVTVPSSTAVGAGVTTASDTHTTHTYHSMTVGAVLTSTDEYLSVASTKVNSPGNLIVDGVNVLYQLVTT